MSTKDHTKEGDDAGWKPASETKREDLSSSNSSFFGKKEWSRNSKFRNAKAKKEDEIMLHIKRGLVKGFQQRNESSKGDGFTQPKQTLVLNFSIERYFNGKQLPPIPVEMRGSGFSGYIKEGDDVEIYEKWREGKLVRTNRVKNWTYGCEVVPKNDISFGQILLHIIFWGALIAGAIALVFLM